MKRSRAVFVAPRCDECRRRQGKICHERAGKALLLCRFCHGYLAKRKEKATVASVPDGPTLDERRAAYRASELAKSRQRLAGKSREQLYNEIMAGRQRKVSKAWLAKEHT